MGDLLIDENQTRKRDRVGVGGGRETEWGERGDVLPSISGDGEIMQ